jgi:serine/threonine protein kinase HipA of HipAB toxin-antitoxin module
MTATFELEEQELDFKLFKKIKRLFKNQHIRLMIESDDLIVQRQVMREKLLLSIKQGDEGNIVSFTPEQFNEISNKLHENSI